MEMYYKRIRQKLESIQITIYNTTSDYQYKFAVIVGFFFLFNFVCLTDQMSSVSRVYLHLAIFHAILLFVDIRQFVINFYASLSFTLENENIHKRYDTFYIYM